VRPSNQDLRKLVVESVTFGLGYVAVLVWVGSALVGSFGYDDANPYWPDLPQLRTDTAGFLAFGVAIVTLIVSKYLELRRRSDGGPTEPAPRSPRVHLVQAVADIAAFLSTALVIYLSCNAFMHPWTLKIQLTHLAPWPSEGTVRVIGLGICLVSVAIRRYLRATASRPSPSQAAPPPGNPDVGAWGPSVNLGVPAREHQGGRPISHRASGPYDS
jgi:hypothetical protein